MFLQTTALKGRRNHYFRSPSRVVLKSSYTTGQRIINIENIGSPSPDACAADIADRNRGPKGGPHGIFSKCNGTLRDDSDGAPNVSANAARKSNAARTYGGATCGSATSGDASPATPEHPQ